MAETSHDHWWRVSSLYQKVLAVEESRRQEFLVNACADEPLRRAVESLLAYLGSPPAAANESLLDRSRTWVGKQLGRYQIVAHLGRGGMGEVYRAHDPRLGRDVAIKVLRPEFSANRDRLARFEREARAAAALNHPNILTVHEIDTDSGAPFIVSELLSGRTVRNVLNEGAIAIPTVLDLARQLCVGLAAAHARHIIHRDLKPENVFVTNEGHVKILDFGLAKLMERPGTSSARPSTTVTTGLGIVLGTLGYVSPEQLRGSSVDHRADIFSVGVMLYEMLTGRRPFGGITDVEVIAGTLQCTPGPLRQLRPEAPVRLARVVSRCITREPGERWQSAKELLDGLQRIELPSRRRPAAAGPQPGSSSTTSHRHSVRSVAVLPFENTGPADDDYLAEGIAELISFALARLPTLRVTGLSSTRVYKGQPVRPADIGVALGVDTVLVGATSRSGQRVHTSVRLVRTSDEHVAWSGSYDRPFTHIADAPKTLAHSIAAELGIELRHRRRQSAPVVPSQAQEAYLRGRFKVALRTRESLQEAHDLLIIATQKAPNYALAHCALAETYVASALSRVLPPGEAMPNAEAAALAALRLDPSLAQAHAVLGYVALYEWDLHRAQRESEKAVSLDPSDPTAHKTLARRHLYVENYSDAIRYTQIAEQLDPLSRFTQLLATVVELCSGRYADCVSRCRRVQSASLQVDDHFLYYEGLAKYFAGDVDEGIEDLKHAVAVHRHPSVIVGLAFVLAQTHQNGALLEQLVSELTDKATEAYASPYDFAELYAGLGDTQKAITYLQRGLAMRLPEMLGIRADPLFRAIKSHPAFHGLLVDLGLT